MFTRFFSHQWLILTFEPVTFTMSPVSTVLTCISFIKISRFIQEIWKWTDAWTNGLRDARTGSQTAAPIGCEGIKYVLRIKTCCKWVQRSASVTSGALAPSREAAGRKGPYADYKKTTQVTMYLTDKTASETWK